VRRARAKGRPINGWLVIDKPAGTTSAQAVAAVKRATRAAKAGHAGTLDPLATGVLPVALGEATKTVPYVMDGRKVYDFTVRWGEARSTDDAEGEVLERSDARPDRAAIEAAIPAFVGRILQVPPVYAAVKVEGRRAYDLARSGEVVVLEARPVDVHDLALLTIPDADHAEFRLVCGKGAYVRALVRDLARAVGTVGHVAAIRRLRAGPFGEADAVPLDRLASVGHNGFFGAYLRGVETALADIPALVLTEPQAQRLRRGQSVVVSRSLFSDKVGEDAPVRAMADGHLVALARISGVELTPVRVFNL
jgi:tRNA pseudouridine55 synthase